MKEIEASQLTTFYINLMTYIVSHPEKRWSIKGRLNFNYFFVLFNVLQWLFRNISSLFCGTSLHHWWRHHSIAYRWKLASLMFQTLTNDAIVPMSRYSCLCRSTENYLRALNTTQGVTKICPFKNLSSLTMTSVKLLSSFKFSNMMKGRAFQ